MKSLFSASMDALMPVTLTVFLVITTVLVVLALRNPLLFKLGARNLPRRRAQTALIVVGLMLSTVIITSAFGTGDTLNFTLRSGYVQSLGAIDETVTAKDALGWDLNSDNSSVPIRFMPSSIVGAIRAGVDPKTVDGVVGVLQQQVPVVDLTSRQSKSTAAAGGIPLDYPPAFGPLITSGGTVVTLAQLGPNQVYLGTPAAMKLNARAGDRLRIYVNNTAAVVVVRAVLRDNYLAAAVDLLLPLPRLQALAGVHGRISHLLVSNTGDNLGGVGLTDTVTSQLRALLANPYEVATAKGLLLTTQGQSNLRRILADPGLDQFDQFQELQAQLHRPGVSLALKSILSDPRVIDRLLQVPAPGYAGALRFALQHVTRYGVQTVKQDGLANADLAGFAATSAFITFGLFSITSGITLIFLIFVMLAAERRTELGIARAIGTKRRHLIQQFVFEGYLYDLGAALLGVLLGVAVGYGAVAIASHIFGTFGFALQWHVEPRSLVSSFCIGALVTFVTVVGSAFRVSRMTIVAAIRDLPDDLRLGGSVRAAFRRPLTDLVNLGRYARRGRLIGTVRSLIAAPWHLFTAFRVFISRGPLLLAIAPLLIGLGISTKQLWPFSIGCSLGLVGVAMVLRWTLACLHVDARVRDRIGFSPAGIFLVAYWLLPLDLIRPDLHFGIEMFFIAGMFLMLGGIWTVMYNIDLILGVVAHVFGGFARLTPIIRMAVTYPMQQRVRTGMTLFMFSLVIFSLVVQSVLTGSLTSGRLDLNRGLGGYDAWGVISPSNPIHQLRTQIAANPPLRARVAAAAAMGSLTVDIRQPKPARGVSSSGINDVTWHSGQSVGIPDDAYFSTTRLPFKVRATGYTSDAQVWQAVRTHPGYAVVAGDYVRSKAGALGDVQLSGVTYESKAFTPFLLWMRDPITDVVVPLTVIGVLDTQQVPDFGTADNMYTSAATLTTHGLTPPVPVLYFFRAAPGQNVHQVTLAIGSAFLRYGIDMKEAQDQFSKSNYVITGFSNLIEGFMGLGLIVGIAALGVIAMRSVVERRREIGMLRALGFQRRMIRDSFLLESSFVAVLGTLIGALLGFLLSYQLVRYFLKTQPGIQFIIPWAQLSVIIVGACAASLLTTYFPARQAARVFPAEVLRHE